VLTEGIRLGAEGTFTKVFNHTNLGDPDMDLSASSFGLITETVGSYHGTSSDFGGRCASNSETGNVYREGAG